MYEDKVRRTLAQQYNDNDGFDPEAMVLFLTTMAAGFFGPLFGINKDNMNQILTDMFGGKENVMRIAKQGLERNRI